MDPFTAVTLGLVACTPVALAVAFFYKQGVEDARRRAWAEPRGFQVSGATVSGRVEGLGVQLSERAASEDSGATVRIQVVCAYPPGFDAFSSLPVFGEFETLGDALHARGDLEVARRLSSDLAARSLPVLGVYNLVNGTLSLRLAGQFGDERIADMLRRMVEVAHAIERVRRQPWQHVADRLALDLSEDGNTIGGTCVGLAVQGHFDGTHTEVVVKLVAPLPGCSIRRTGPSIRLGDPVLDGVIAVQGEALRPLLKRDDTRGNVLAVIHAHPLSEVTDDQVVLRVNGRLDDGLEQAIEDAIHLAEALAPVPPQG